MNRFRTVVVDTDYTGGQGFFFSETKAINELGGEIRFENYRTEQEIIDGCRDAEIIICCGNPPITDKVLSSIPAKMIIRNGIGVNSIDLNAAIRYGKIIFNTPSYCTEELAMHASGLILASIRNIGYYNNLVKKGKWPKGEGPSPRRLSNMTIGLYGFGESARSIATIFTRGYRSKVIACDPYVNADIMEKYNVKCVNFDLLLEDSDVISIHAPLTDDTYHMFNKDTFKKMKKDALLVNTSRGGLVCEDDLIVALQENQIGSAALDVLENEPISPDNPLIFMDQVVITPHSAFYGKEADENSHVIVADLIKGYYNRILPLKNIANKGVIEVVDGFIFK